MVKMAKTSFYPTSKTFAWFVCAQLTFEKDENEKGKCRHAFLARAMLSNASVYQNLSGSYWFEVGWQKCIHWFMHEFHHSVLSRFWHDSNWYFRENPHMASRGIIFFVFAIIWPPKRNHNTVFMHPAWYRAGISHNLRAGDLFRLRAINTC